MKKVYICSPYRAEDSAELDRHIDYAQELTKLALEAGLAPIAPHLYITQCLNEDKPAERAQGMAAGLELLKGCDFVLVGAKYGISAGMEREIRTANLLSMDVVNADRLRYYTKERMSRAEAAAHDYAAAHACGFCIRRGLHSCTGYDCKEPYKRAYEYAMKHKDSL